MHDIKEKPKMVERAMLVGLTFPNQTIHETSSLLFELRDLVTSLGIEVNHEVQLTVRKTHARFLLGSGNATKLIGMAHAHDCDVIIFDNELTPTQQRNWEQAANDKLLVIDRQEVILDIFSQRAKTKEARLQVELARLQYNLPRLKSAWTHLSRQRGGGALQRDAGETQLELDQRMVRTKITRVKRELEVVIKNRSLQRKKRMDIPMPTCAIVGYTNAGKSSLLNKLTHSDIFAEDQLFATLDPTSRRCQLPNGHTLVMTDTVGFVRNLPHRLVDAFKATLEEAVVSDFLIHVLDASNTEIDAHMATTRLVLKELGADSKQILTVFNKMDVIEEAGRKMELSLKYPGAIFVSVRTGEGIRELLQSIETIVEEKFTQMQFLIPYKRYDLIARIHREGAVYKEKEVDQGIYVVGSVPAHLLKALQPYHFNARTRSLSELS